MGKLVVLEGIDGSGKTTALATVAEALKKEGMRCLQFKEPGTTKLGKLIYDIYHKGYEGEELAEQVELLLFQAARVQLEPLLFKALSDNAVVFLDRWIPSSFVYQGLKYPGHFITQLCRESLTITQSDLCILLDVAVDTAMERENMESDHKNLNKMSWWAARYRELAATEGGMQGRSWRVVNANRSKEEVASEVYDLVRRILK